MEKNNTTEKKIQYFPILYYRKCFHGNACGRLYKNRVNGLFPSLYEKRKCQQSDAAIK